MVLTLAVDLQELITLAIFLIFMLGGSIASALKKSAEEREARRQMEEGQQPGRTGQRTQLDEKVARRRRQLEELAARRRGGGASGGASGGAAGGASGGASPSGSTAPRREPGNLTIGEAAARERAKQQYEERAARLRQQREAAEREAAAQQARAQRDRDRRARPSPVEPRRPVRPAARPDVSPPRRDRPAPAPKPAARQPQRTPAAQAVTPPVTPIPRSPSLASTFKDAYDRPETIRLEGMKLDRKALRQAIIMSEVLGPPVALRPDSP